MKKEFFALSILMSASICFADVLMPSGEDDTVAIQTAIDTAPEGGTVTLGDGLFILKNEILIERNVTVKSEHGRDFTQIKQIAGSADAVYRVFHINHPQARVEGFAISNTGANVNPTGDAFIPGNGVLIDAEGGLLCSCIVSNCNTLTLGSVNLAGEAAVMSNCIVTANKRGLNRALNRTTTVGVQIGAGLVTHCTIAGNVGQWGNYGAILGGGVYLTGGRLSYSCVTNNQITKVCSDGSRGGGVYIASGAPVVDNCLIAGNSTVGQGGGVFVAVDAKGSFTNCTIVANTASAGAGGIHLGARAKPVFYGCIVQDNVNGSGYGDIEGTTAVLTHCATDGNVTFSDGYVPDFGTSASDICPVSDYPFDLSSAVDLSGNPRLSGVAVDAGAFEYQVPDFIASVDILSDPVQAPGEIFSFTGKVTCTDASLVKYGWSVDGEEKVWTDAAYYEVALTAAGIHTLTLDVLYDGEDKGSAGTVPFLVTNPDVYVIDPVLNPGHVPVYPYSTPEGAAIDLQEAVGCARSGTTVHVGPGAYDISKPLELVGAVRLVSDEGRDKTVIRQTATGGTENRIVHLDDQGAVLDGFALTGGSGHLAGIAACIDSAGGVIRNCLVTNNVTGSSGGALAVLSAVGVISNCVVRYNTAIVGDNNAAGPVGMRIGAGLVVDCDISCNTNAYGFAWGENCGIGAYLTGGRLTRCTVCDNASTKTTNNGAGGYGAGVYIADSSAVVDNCLIARNYSVENRGAVAFNTSGKASGTVLNCTIVDNAAIGVFAGDNRLGNIVNTLIQGNVNKSGVPEECTLTSKLVYKTSLCPTALPDGYGNVTASAVFKGEGDYHLVPGTPGCRKGAVAGFEQYLIGGLDLDGEPRTTTARNRIDIGCYQSVGLGLMLLLK